MAYDVTLAERIRELLAEEPGITEQRMFGGLAFMIDGKMAVSAGSQGGIFFRIDPAKFESLVAKSAAEPMVMRGREMHGWLRVAAADLRTRRQLQRWVGLGVGYVRTMAG